MVCIFNPKILHLLRDLKETACLRKKEARGDATVTHVNNAPSPFFIYLNCIGSMIKIRNVPIL